MRISFEENMGTFASSSDMIHVMEEHIGQNKEDMIERLLTEKNMRGKKMQMVSTFNLSNETLIKLIRQCLRLARNSIEIWMEDIDNTDFLELVIKTKSILGFAVCRGTKFTDTFQTSNIKIVLKKDSYREYFSLVTAYPLPNEAEYEKIKKAREEFMQKKH